MIQMLWNYKKIIQHGSYAKYSKGFYIVLTNYTYRFQKSPLGAFNFEKTILDQFSYENSIP